MIHDLTKQEALELMAAHLAATDAVAQRKRLLDVLKQKYEINGECEINLQGGQLITRDQDGMAIER